MGYGDDFTDWMKGQDMFGHSIALNFMKEGDEVQTKIGGFFSIIIRVMMTIYVGLNLKKLFFRQ